MADTELQEATSGDAIVGRGAGGGRAGPGRSVRGLHDHDRRGLDRVARQPARHVFTAAQLEAKTAIRALERRKSGEAEITGPVVAFRAAPMADTAEDAQRIFDALNWAQSQWPDMVLATTGAKGAEKVAIRWAQQKKVTLVLARADFDRFQKAGAVPRHDDLLALEPACCLIAGAVARRRPTGPVASVRAGGQPGAAGRSPRAPAHGDPGQDGLIV